LQGTILNGKSGRQVGTNREANREEERKYGEMNEKGQHRYLKKKGNSRKSLRYNAAGWIFARGTHKRKRGDIEGKENALTGGLDFDKAGFSKGHR